jgi:hypothetical protein
VGYSAQGLLGRGESGEDHVQVEGWHGQRPGGGKCVDSVQASGREELKNIPGRELSGKLPRMPK